MWITSMSNQGAAGVSQNAGVLVILVYDYDGIMCVCMNGTIFTAYYHIEFFIDFQ